MTLRGRVSDIMLQREIENGKLLVEKASEGDIDSVKDLLGRGVPVNAEAYNQSLYYRSKNYFSPLHVAAGKGHAEIVKLLINANGIESFAILLFWLVSRRHAEKWVFLLQPNRFRQIRSDYTAYE